MKIVCTTYDGPDLDGYGCSVAYAELLRAQGKDAEAHIWGTPHLEVQWLLNEYDLEQVSDDADPNAKVVLLDTSDPESLQGRYPADQVIEVIDHRKLHFAEKFTNAKIQIELVGAAATLVAERFKEANITPSKESAILLYGGILSNTQNFSGTATDRDREMAKWLKEVSGAPDDFAQRMFLAKSDLSGSKLQETLIGDSKALKIKDKIVGTLQLEIIGIDDLIKTRRDEIETELTRMKNDHNCDYAFVNMKDLDSGISSILCADDETRELLGKAPGIKWDGRLGKSSTFTLRKQITAWINENLPVQ